MFTGQFDGARSELSIKSEWFEKLVLIGGSRSLEMGGSPSFRFIGRLNKSFEEFTENWDKSHPRDHWEYDKFFSVLLPDTNEKIIQRLRQFGEKYIDRIPSSTLVSFYFLEEYLKAGNNI